MPIIVQYNYADGSSEKITYPAEIWRLNDESVSKVVASEKELTSVQLDPDEETADIDTSNNAWPKRKKLGAFEKFKKENGTD